MTAKKNTDPQNSPEDLAEKLRIAQEALEAAQKENEAKDREIAEMRETAGHKFNPKGEAMTGPDGGWLFRIECLNKEDYPHLEDKEVRACDESEVKRWYCYTNETRPNSGTCLDPMKVRFKITCVEAQKRAEGVVKAHKIAALRQKLKVGAALSEEDKALAQECESKIWKIPQLTGE